MTQYEDFKKDTLYALARNGGSMYLSDLRSKYDELNMDALDFHLHLRQMQDEKLVDRSLVTDTSSTSGSELSILIRRPRKRSCVDLTAAGWDWVRQHRAAEMSAEAPTSPPPSADSGN